jgi:hypothetical protein
MRTSRLARTALVRNSLISIPSLTRTIYGSGLPVTSRSVTATAFSSIRQLASAAALTHQVGTTSVLPTTVDPERAEHGALISRVESVDRLLRDGIGGSDVWIERLQKVKEDLVIPRSRRIAGMFTTLKQRSSLVVGDAISGARDVVSSLLQDPISDTTTSRQALLGRHVDANRSILSIR